MPSKTRISFPHAFPSAGVVGLSLRDYFAAAAMQGYAALDAPAELPYETATNAYRMADAMLAAREVQP